MFRKKKFWIVSIIVLIVIILGILIVVNKRKEDRSFINYDYPSTIYVDNQTEYKRIDTIVYVLSSKIMKIDTISMHIFGMPRHLDRDDF